MLAFARRRQTRRRLLAGAPAERIRGAWLTVLDALRLAGHRPPPYLSVTEIVDWASGPPGALPGLGELAELANLVAFAPQWADESDAAAAAAQAKAYARALHAGQSWWKRLLWTVRPGPLVWRHGAPRLDGVVGPGAARGRVRVRPASPVAAMRLHGHTGRHRESAHTGR